MASDFGYMFQLAQSVLNIGFVLAKRVGQGEVGGCTALVDSAWWWLQLTVEKPWSMPGGPFMLLSPCRDSISGILGSF